MMMIRLDPLTISLVLGWMSFTCVRANPTSKFIIELSACGMNADNVDSMLPHQCHSICQVVIDAQQECEREARCTCSRVPPSILQSCIQCSIDALPSDHQFESVSLIPIRMKAYSEVCGVSQRDISIFSTNLTTHSTETDTTSMKDAEVLSKRELNNLRCLYGLPEVVEMRSHWRDFSPSTGAGPWPVLLFFVVAGLCYAENRRLKVSSKAQQG